MNRRRIAVLLSLVLGTALISAGLGTDALAKDSQPTCIASASTPRGIPLPFSCPTGTITVDENSIVPPGSTAVAPSAGWSVEITSPNCTDPNGATVDITLLIPDGSSTTTSSDPGLFVYADPQHTTPCQYALAPQAVTGFTGVLVPPSPVVIADDGEVANTTVTLTETALAPSSSSSAETSSTPVLPSSSAPSLTLPAGSVSAIASESDQVGSSSSPVGATQTTAALAETGPRTQVGLMVWAGIALLALGLVMLLTGVRPEPGDHRSH